MRKSEKKKIFESVFEKNSNSKKDSRNKVEEKSNTSKLGTIQKSYKAQDRGR